jgi:hypothetical protein
MAMAGGYDLGAEDAAEETEADVDAAGVGVAVVVADAALAVVAAGTEDELEELMGVGRSNRWI